MQLQTCCSLADTLFFYTCSCAYYGAGLRLLLHDAAVFAAMSTSTCMSFGLPGCCEGRLQACALALFVIVIASMYVVIRLWWREPCLLLLKTAVLCCNFAVHDIGCRNRVLLTWSVFSFGGHCMLHAGCLTHMCLYSTCRTLASVRLAELCLMLLACLLQQRAQVIASCGRSSSIMGCGTALTCVTGAGSYAAARPHAPWLADVGPWRRS